MFKRFQGFLFGCLVCFTLTSVVIAKTGTEPIQAFYNNIKIYVDGIKIDPKDASGKTVEPFIYNGTSYLPVRAVGEAIGKTVIWDGTTQTVYLGEKPGDTQFLTDVCPPYDGLFRIVCSKNGEYITVAGEKHTDAITFESKYVTDKLPALFNLDGKYQHLTFKIGRVDESLRENATLNIYLDNKLVKTCELKADGLPQEIEVNLNNALGMKIELADASQNFYVKQYAIFDAIIE